MNPNSTERSGVTVQGRTFGVPRTSSEPARTSATTNTANETLASAGIGATLRHPNRRL